MRKDLQTTIQGAAKTGFFGFYDRGHKVSPFAHFRECPTHGLCQHGHEPVHKGFIGTEYTSEASRASEDPPHHIASPLIGGRDTICNGEGQRANMICNHSECVVCFVAEL